MEAFWSILPPALIKATGRKASARSALALPWWNKSFLIRALLWVPHFLQAMSTLLYISKVHDRHELLQQRNNDANCHPSGCTAASFYPIMSYKKKRKKALESAMHSITLHTCAPRLYKTTPRFSPKGDLGAHLEALTSLPASFIAKAICDDWRISVVIVILLLILYWGVGGGA